MNLPASIVVTVCLSGLISACGTAGYSGGNDAYGDDSYGSAPATTAKASNPASPVKEVNSPVGTVLAAGPDNLTLYTFGKDTSFNSVCYETCAAAWPPFYAKAGAKDFEELTVIDRKDGTQQWVLRGQPLYFWAGDKQEGETSGTSIPNWFLAK